MKCNTVLIKLKLRLILQLKLIIKTVLLMINYTQITEEERVKIYEYKKIQMGVRAIAKKLKRAPSSISRELRRNSDRIGYLYPRDAHEATKRRKAKLIPKMIKNRILRAYVIEKLNKYWSPSAIAGRWNLDNPYRTIQAETIYRFIYAKFSRNLELYKLLPRKKKKRGFIMRIQRNKAKIPDRISVHVRPSDVLLRHNFGHCESDLFFNKGSMSANVLNSIERKSRKIFLVKNKSKSSKNVQKALNKSIGYFAQTNTMDNGTEFSRHTDLNKKGIKTYFCDPGSPWQKGSVENANGLLRRFIPFKLYHKAVTQEYLNQIMDIVNNTPRKVLGYLTPNEVFFAEFTQKFAGVALRN